MPENSQNSTRDNLSLYKALFKFGGGEVNMGTRARNNTKWLTNVFPRLSEIRDWCMDGKTNEEMCVLLGISPDSWYTYMKEHIELNDIVTAGKSVIDNRVENAVLKTALGFEYEEIKTIIEEDRNGKKRTRIEKTMKYMPPNLNAQAFWLKNRKKDEWGDRIVFDTKAQEEERKSLFLKMVNDEIIDANYSVVEEAATLPDPEVIEEAEEGFIDEFEGDDFGNETSEA